MKAAKPRPATIQISTGRLNPKPYQLIINDKNKLPMTVTLNNLLKIVLLLILLFILLLLFSGL